MVHSDRCRVLAAGDEKEDVPHTVGPVHTEAAVIPVAVHSFVHSGFVDCGLAHSGRVHSGPVRGEVPGAVAPSRLVTRYCSSGER